MKHPIQNTHIDAQGILRFVSNGVVRLMLEMLKTRGADLNAIRIAGNSIPQEDWDQFNQLIGYSVGNAPIDPAITYAAQLAHENGHPIDTVRADAAEELLVTIQKALREGIAELYGIHPDNLMEIEP